MKTLHEDLGQSVAVAVQTLGATLACIALVAWAWSLAEGSVLGFVLLCFFGALFVAPLLAWALPVVSLAAGLLVQGVASLIRWHRSRA